MILLVFAALGFLIGLLTGGSFRGMARYALAGVLLPIAAYLLKAGATLLFAPQTGAIIVSLLQYSLIFLFLLLNYRRPIWPLVAFIGSLLNFLVIVLNGGCMPVSASLLSGAGERLTQLLEGRVYAYCLTTASTCLPLLGDIIRIGPASMPFGYASVGDIILCIGISILCWQMTQTPREAGDAEKKA